MKAGFDILFVAICISIDCYVKTRLVLLGMLASSSSYGSCCHCQTYLGCRTQDRKLLFYLVAVSLVDEACHSLSSEAVGSSKLFNVQIAAERLKTHIYSRLCCCVVI